MMIYSSLLILTSLMNLQAISMPNLDTSLSQSFRLTINSALILFNVLHGPILC